MKYIKKLRLNTVLKLSIIVLAIAGIYYFITATQVNQQSSQPSSPNPQADFAMKQKCNEAGAALAKSQQAGILNSLFVYNSSLNTCLAYFEDELPSENKDLGLVVGNIYNVFSNSQILHQGCTYSISNQTFLSCQVNNSTFISRADELMGQSICGGLFDLCEVSKSVSISR